MFQLVGESFKWVLLFFLSFSFFQFFYFNALGCILWGLPRCLYLYFKKQLKFTGVLVQFIPFVIWNSLALAGVWLLVRIFGTPFCDFLDLPSIQWGESIAFAFFLWNIYGKEAREEYEESLVTFFKHTNK
jgi:hypothetical protein